MRLSTFGYYADFFISMASIAVLASAALIGSSIAQSLQWAGFAVLGAAFWTFLEYVVHRVLYHQVPYFEELHDAHHAEPNAFIGAPPIIGVLLAFLIFYAPFSAVSFVAASGVTSGILAGYMAYMLLHHCAHFMKPPEGSFLYRARRHHALHHHHHDLGNFGITTAFWDHAFGTALEPRGRASRYKLR